MAEQVEITNENQELVKCFSDCCESYFSLKKGDVFSRRNALKEIHNYVLICEPHLLEKSNSISLLKSLTQALILSLSDESEKCRELSVAILKILFNRFIVDSESLVTLFKTIANCLGKTDERERSEEIRVLELELLIQVINKTNGSLLEYLNDIAIVISACIVDDCPEIKRKSCECLSLLASKEESHFHMVGGTFLTPLLASITHQHMKTRILCVKALGKILDYLNSDEFEKAASYLAQRLFDHSPAVRLAVTEVIGSMMLELKERYSYFPRLIPIMLSTLYDDVPEVRFRGKELWHKAGFQYLKENEKDYKDLIDFPPDLPKDYPITDRPPIGCRILVQRNSYKIFPPLLNELSDWVENTRAKCSTVLYSIILHSEEKITAQLSDAIDGIAFSAKDESKECVEMAVKSAELLGYFVDPNLLCDTIMTLIHKTPSSSNLRIFAASLKGFSSTYSAECFEEICKFLANPSISRLRQADEQVHLLSCVEALLSSGNKIDQRCSELIFIILLSVAGLSKNDSILFKAEELLKILADIQSYNLSSLFQQHSYPILKSLTSNYELWNSQSPEMPIFSYILRSGFLTTEDTKIVIPIFRNNLHPSKDARVRSVIFSLIPPTFQSLSSENYDLISKDILTLIRDGIFPNLIWSAGKTASKLRALASASLYEIVAKHSFGPALLKQFADEILPILATLSDDEETTTRLLSCKILESILPHINGSVDDQKIHNTCFQLLRCMDDESDDVRIMTVRVLKAYVKSFPSDYDWKMYKAHVKHIYENVLVHMDDKNEKIRQCVLNLLKDIGFAAPDVLLDEVESKRYVMSANDLCDKLIEHIKNIKV